MGAGSSNPGKNRSSSSGPRQSSHKSSWTQAHQNGTSRPAAPTNLNVNRALGTSLAANNGQRRQLHHPTAPTRNAIHAEKQINSKPVVLVTRQPVTVIQQVNRPQAPRNQTRPRPTKGAGGGVKPKINYRNVECGVCGHTGHSAERCKHRHNSCYICHQPGHLASVCSQKVHHNGSRYRPRAGEY